MPQYAMVIDLQRCVGCSACSIACRNENNVSEGVFWSNKITETVGVFPNVRYHYIPTLCNHCEDAPCVRGCPTSAMHKLDNGITMHDPDKCIGCRYCMFNCPYGVIYFNWEDPNKFWNNNQAVLKGCTSTPQETADAVNKGEVPYQNPDRGKTQPAIRSRGVVEKCTFCDHLVKRGKLPYCVEACPSDARVFGDLEDKNSEVHKLLNKFKPTRIKEHLGTRPKVYYVRGFNPAHHHSSKGGV